MEDYQKVRQLCKVNGCDAPSRARGWCNAHYKRWKRNGSPSGGKTGLGEIDQWIENLMAGKPSNDCIVWPFAKSKNGYGVVARNGIYMNSSRYICILKNGSPQTRCLQAAHSCGNGHLGCVNPDHLRWATAVENQLDRVEHGTIGRGEKHSQARLNMSQVGEIRSLKGVLKQSEIAEMFGISQRHVSDIQLGKRWASYTYP